MFSELPKLIDRNYAIGYATPSALFLLLLVLLLNDLGVINATAIYQSQLNSDPFLGTAFVVFLAWLVGLLLSAFNRGFIRFLSGTGKFNPLQFQKRNQIATYRALQERIAANVGEVYRQNDAIHNQGKLGPLEEERAKLAYAYSQLDQDRHKRSYYFPYERHFSDGLLLPTELGNIIRAFETYPRIMYGLDGSIGWHRLIYVVPREALDVIVSAKSYFDLWLNLCILSGIFSFICTLAFVWKYATSVDGQWIFLLWPVTLFTAWFSLSRCKEAAIIWGETIKAAYDVYLPALAKALGRGDLWRNYEYWTNFSVATTYKAFHRMGIYAPVSRDMSSGKDATKWDQGEIG